MSAFAVRDIDDLFPEVMAYVPKAPEQTVMRFLREAARDLCKRGRMWKATDEFTVSTPTAEAISTIPDARIHAIEWAELNGQKLTPQSPEWLDSNKPGWQDFVDTGTAEYVTQTDRNTVRIVPPVVGVLKMRYVLIPSSDAMTLPAFLVDDYATEIGIGAAGRILVLPHAEFQNPQLAGPMIARFDGLLNRVFTESTKGQQRTRPRSRGNFF